MQISVSVRQVIAKLSALVPMVGRRLRREPARVIDLASARRRRVASGHHHPSVARTPHGGTRLAARKIGQARLDDQGRQGGSDGEAGFCS